MKSQQQERVLFFTQPDLKDRGWTEYAIKNFLGSCDRTENSLYNRSRPTKLWSQDKVIRVEKSREFKNWVKEVKRKREVSSERLHREWEVKRKEFAQYISTLEITIPRIEITELIRLSCNHFNDYREPLERDMGSHDFKPASFKSDPYFLERIVCNYLRHETTGYDALIDNIISRFNGLKKKEVYDALKERFNNEITKVYPNLLDKIVDSRR